MPIRRNLVVDDNAGARRSSGAPVEPPGPGGAEPLGRSLALVASG